MCEGKRTERDYLDTLVARLRIPHVTVKAAGCDPLRLVEKAKDWRRLRGVDEVWCVFDRDTHAHFDQALSMAQKAGFEVAASYPCFEVWLLLHFERTTRSFGDFDAVRGALERHVGAYDKAQPCAWRTLGPRLHDACTHAAHLKRWHAAQGNPPLTNPWTDMDLLVERLRALAAPL